MPADVEIEIVGEQRIELDAQQPALGHHRPMLLGDGVEMLRRIAAGEHHRLATEAAHLRAADVEHIGQACNVGQREVAGRAREPVAQPGAVDHQRQLVGLADVVDRLQLAFRIDRAVFSRERDVDHPGKDHVLVIRVGGGRLQIVAQLGRVHLALVSGNREHLVPRVFHGTRLVDADVARLGRHHTLVVAQHGRNHGRIGLRAAHQEEYFRLRRIARRADLLFGAFAIMIHAVARQLFKVGRGQARKNLRMRPFRIVASKRNHARYKYVFVQRYENTF